MIDWCRTHYAQGAKRWKRELERLSMGENDSFKFFGLRITEIAQKAYPKNDKECAKKMQEKFTHTTPKWFNQKLQQRLDIVAARSIKDPY